MRERTLMKKFNFVWVLALMILAWAKIAQAGSGDIVFYPGYSPTVAFTGYENVMVTFSESESEPVTVSQDDSDYVVDWNSDGVTFDAYPLMNPLLPTLNGTLVFLPNGDVKFNYAFAFYDGGAKGGSVVFNNSRVISMASCECSYQTDITTCAGSSKNCEKHVQCARNIKGAECWDNGIKIPPPPPPTKPGNGMWANFFKWVRSWFSSVHEIEVL